MYEFRNDCFKQSSCTILNVTFSTGVGLSFVLMVIIDDIYRALGRWYILLAPYKLTSKNGNNNSNDNEETRNLSIHMNAHSKQKQNTHKI